MIKLIKETKPTIRKTLKEDTKGGAIDNKAFYDIAERVLKIMKKLEITNSFDIKSYGEIITQSEVMLNALDTIETAIDGHINNYIDNEF